MPSNAEWDILLRFVDGTSGTESPYSSKTAGKYLKAKIGWNDYKGESTNGTDTYNFSALPSGIFAVFNSKSKFSEIGIACYWWSSTSKYDAFSNYIYFMHNVLGEDAVLNVDNIDKNSLYSIRCVQD